MITEKNYKKYLIYNYMANQFIKNSNYNYNKIIF